MVYVMAAARWDTLSPRTPPVEPVTCLSSLQPRGTDNRRDGRYFLDASGVH